MLHFTKMHGAGNDYIYIYNLEKDMEDTIVKLIPRMCNRNFGIGADGVILIEKSDIADFKMRMFNADATEGKMCGNGIRCVGKYVREKGLTDKEKLTIETKAGIKSIYLTIEKNKVEKVKVDMGKAIFNLNGQGEKIQPFVIETSCGKFKCFYLTIGNPHTVVILHTVEELAKLDIENIGREIGENILFKDKSNVEFVVIQDRNLLQVRVWERGSGETLACGTGACAVVAALNNLELVGKSVKVNMKGGMLNVDLIHTKVYLEGEANFVYEGEYYNV